MADNVQPDAGEQREESSSGLLLSVDPLQGTNNYKLAGDDDSGGDKGGLLGDDASDSDGSDSDSLPGGDSDAADADAADAASIVPDGDSSETDDKMNPLGIGDTNVDGPD